MMTPSWKFEATIRANDTRFNLDDAIPFIGDYEQAQTQAQARKAKWEQDHHQAIDHVELLFSITPCKQQVSASLLRLAGHALASVIELGCSDEMTSHNIIMLEKNGRRKTDTIQSACWKAAAEVVQNYLTDAAQRKLYDICAVAYNGVVGQGAAIENAFICRMYGAGLGSNCFAYQAYQPSSETTALSFIGAPELNLDEYKIEGRSVWFEILMQGCLQHAEQNDAWDHMNHINLFFER